MELTFFAPLAVFALLPLGLFSLFERGRHRATAGFGFLAALAPVVASGLSSLVRHKQAQSAEKKQAEYERQLAAQEEANRRAAFEAQQNSPAAALQRQSFNMKLGRLLGFAGGRDKLPPSLVAGYDVARKPLAYTPGAAYIPKPTSGAGIWDVIGGAGEALSYFDPSRLKKSGVGGATTTPPIDQAPTNQVNQYFRLRGSGTRDFG